MSVDEKTMLKGIEMSCMMSHISKQWTGVWNISFKPYEAMSIGW